MLQWPVLKETEKSVRDMDMIVECYCHNEFEIIIINPLQAD